MAPIKLSKQQKEALKAYEYHGRDPSLFYQYFLSPIADYFVKFLPLTIAPNQVTLAGLYVSIVSTVITLLSNPQLLPTSDSNIISFITGISILIYQTLDNMDGKQARRTNSSSPLGLLFDHGCDAINAGLVSISMASVYGTGWTIKIFLGFFVAFLPFYFQTWEEYYVGKMVLPIVNGPSEGLFIIAIFSFISGYYGTAFWQIRNIAIPEWILSSSALSQDLKVLLELNDINSMTLECLDNNSEGNTCVNSSNTIYISPFQVLIFIGVIWSVLTMFHQTISVMITVQKRGKSMLKAFSDLMPLLVYFSAVFVWCCISPIPLILYPITSMFYICSIFVEIAVHIMLNHITDGVTNPLERVLAYSPVFLLTVSYFSEYQTNVPSVEEYAFLGLTIFSFAVTCDTLNEMCSQVSKALGLRLFSLEPLNAIKKPIPESDSVNAVSDNTAKVPVEDVLTLEKLNEELVAFIDNFPKLGKS